MIKKKTIKIDNFEYIIEQPSAIKAMAMTALASRISRASSELSVGAGDFDEDGFERDLNKLLKNNELVKVITGKSKNGLPTAKPITGDHQLPGIGGLGELLVEVIEFMFEFDDEATGVGSGGK